MPLQDGALLAFGGDHFTYRVGITQAGSTCPAPAGRAARRPRARAGPAPDAPPPITVPPAARPLSWRLRPRSSRSSASRPRWTKAPTAKRRPCPPSPIRRLRDAARAGARWRCGPSSRRSSRATMADGARRGAWWVAVVAGGRAGAGRRGPVHGGARPIASSRSWSRGATTHRPPCWRTGQLRAAPGRCGAQGACHRSRPQGERAGLAGQGGRARLRWRRRRDRRHVAARPAQSRAAAAGGRTGMAGPARAAGQPARRTGHSRSASTPTKTASLP